ncbi:MAG: hypothetical protein EOO77_33705 [Oxalobacteraceae bacterium]|jgi:hypothetical protein|nr:MAG: hypothetical protein EOO77_33705 [Oxalobacteraceae bacterium]
MQSLSMSPRDARRREICALRRELRALRQGARQERQERKDDVMQTAIMIGGIGCAYYGGYNIAAALSALASCGLMLSAFSRHWQIQNCRYRAANVERNLRNMQNGYRPQSVTRRGLSEHIG